MIDISAEERRSAFSIWLRTGRRPTIRPDGVELKFNPYHDPRNGQFTFAPGGPQSLGDVTISDRGSKSKFAPPPARDPSTSTARLINRATLSVSSPAPTADRSHFPSGAQATLQPVQMLRFPRGPRTTGRGSNSGEIPYDPVVLAQVFPGLQRAPGSAVIAALADNAIGATGPARELNAELTKTWTEQLINDIKRIDPKFRYDSFGFPQTAEGQNNQINELRMIRAAVYVRVKGELRPLQVEVLRLMQRSADRAYDEGLARQRAGQLKPRLSDPEALGNFVDRQVRTELREKLRYYGIDEAGGGVIRVNRRENSGSEATYRRPDARVGKVAYDVTLAAKTLKTPQVRGFFETDFKPSYTIIVRPRQLDKNSTYIIKRPEPKQ